MAVSGQNLEGKRLYESGQYTAAVERFQGAIQEDPENADAYYNMASAYHRMGIDQGNQSHLAQAEMLYNLCLDKNEDHVDCHRALAVLLVETGRTDAAFRLMKNWAGKSPDFPDARIELARLYQEFGDPSTAKVHLDQAIQIDPANARAWSASGMLHEQTGNYNQALANYYRSYNSNSLQPEVVNRIASIQRSMATTSTSGGTTTGGTRLVTPAQPILRY